MGEAATTGSKLCHILQKRYQPLFSSSTLINKEAPNWQKIVPKFKKTATLDYIIASQQLVLQ
jgi:hypothetical protein